MIDKKKARLRRARRARAKIRELKANRLCIHRTPRHIYAQIINGDGSNVICTASTLDKDLRGKKRWQCRGCDRGRQTYCRTCEGKMEFRWLLSTVPVSLSRPCQSFG